MPWYRRASARSTSASSSPPRTSTMLSSTTSPSRSRRSFMLVIAATGPDRPGHSTNVANWLIGTPTGGNAAGEGHRKGTDVSVGRTYQHANRVILVEGDPLPLRLARFPAKPGGAFPRVEVQLRSAAPREVSGGPPAYRLLSEQGHVEDHEERVPWTAQSRSPRA